MVSILEKIIANKRIEVEKRKKLNPLHCFADKLIQSDRDFKEAILKKNGKVSIIAELKKASPISGVLRENFDIPKIVKVYDKYANAISVVTDQKFFQGNYETIASVKKLTKLPVLMKDFIIDEYQVFEARHYNADAILLIAALLSIEEIEHFSLLAKLLKMQVVLEISSLEEMDIAQSSSVEIIGINNRNLNDFTIDLNRTLILGNRKNNSKLIISESGVKTKEDVAFVRDIADAVLIGSTFMREEKIENLFKNLNV